jgi:effector-binding domain-containing protein
VITDVTDLKSMEVLVPATRVLACSSSSGTDSGAISAAVGAAFEKISAFQRDHHIQASGPPRVVYLEWSPTAVKFTAQMPIAEMPPPNVVDTPDVAIKATSETQALRFEHRGPYRDVRNTYDRIEAWLRARGGIKMAADWAHYAPMWEEYLNDPATTPESDLITRIYLTLK